jgi:lysine 2,3-aminomutase
MQQLVHKLLLMRVRPYYLYQCDPISGSSHFRTPVSKGLEIIQGLRGFTTGYAVPTYVIDAPGGGGKIPLQPDTVIGRDGDDLLLKNFEGKCSAIRIRWVMRKAFFNLLSGNGYLCHARRRASNH